MPISITPELVSKAYGRIGFKPIQDEFMRLNQRSCCGLSAIAMDSGLFSPEELQDLVDANEDATYYVRDAIAAGLDLSTENAADFIAGFDGGSPMVLPQTGMILSAEHEAWRSLGQQCWEAAYVASYGVNYRDYLTRG